MAQIAILADFDPTSETHAATAQALRHSAEALHLRASVTWLPTDQITADIFDNFDGIWAGTGSYHSAGKVLWALEHARRNDFPTLATCGGFQHMILEIARNELNFPDAAHAEYDPGSPRQVITRLQCSLRGRRMQLRLEPGSLAARLYGSTEATEKYYCGFGVNPEYADLFKNSMIRIVGSDAEGELRVIEIPDHRFFMGTLFVPQAQSTGDKPHPLISGFCEPSRIVLFAANGSNADYDFQGCSPD